MNKDFNFKKNQRKHANRKIKKEQYIIQTCGSVLNYYREVCFLSAYGFDAVPTCLPQDLIPRDVLNKL